jgi:hypothetical protein
MLGDAVAKANKSVGSGAFLKIHMHRTAAGCPALTCIKIEIPNNEKATGRGDSLWAATTKSLSNTTHRKPLPPTLSSSFFLALLMDCEKSVCSRQAQLQNFATSLSQAKLQLVMSPNHVHHIHKTASKLFNKTRSSCR